MTRRPFHEAWRCVIQRYGIFNLYTGRGAIRDLLPHGPHNVRDPHPEADRGPRAGELSDLGHPELIAQHYGRFLSHDKAGVAARVLNRVGEDG